MMITLVVGVVISVGVFAVALARVAGKKEPKPSVRSFTK